MYTWCPLLGFKFCITKYYTYLTVLWSMCVCVCVCVCVCMCTYVHACMHGVCVWSCCWMFSLRILLRSMYKEKIFPILKFGWIFVSDSINFDELQPYDVADLLKQYFRELPECLLTNKLSDTFRSIFTRKLTLGTPWTCTMPSISSVFCVCVLWSLG